MVNTAENAYWWTLPLEPWQTPPKKTALYEELVGLGWGRDQLVEALEHHDLQAPHLVDPSRQTQALLLFLLDYVEKGIIPNFPWWWDQEDLPPSLRQSALLP